jgi:Uncharacterized protein involved in cation transport
MTMAQATPADLWVFGYGSLMWDPCFPFVESGWGIVRGYHRSLCILSIRNRGTPEQPGLVLGLERGGACRGRVFRIEAPCVDAAREALWAREMPNQAYVPRGLRVRLDDGRTPTALAFIARPGHPQFVPRLAIADAAAMVARGRGATGTAIDYLRNVVHHLDAFRIADGPLHRVLALADAIATPASA